MRYILKVLFAGVVLFVILLFFSCVIVRGCTRALEISTEELKELDREVTAQIEELDEELLRLHGDSNNPAD